MSLGESRKRNYCNTYSHLEFAFPNDFQTSVAATAGDIIQLCIYMWSSLKTFFQLQSDTFYMKYRLLTILIFQPTDLLNCQA